METKKSFILITGASSGIGRCLATRLSEHNNVILHGRNEERLQETKALCSKNTEQLIFKADLSNVGEIESVLASFIAGHSIEVSSLVHCAGFMKMLPLKILTLEAINTTFNTNVVSAMLLSKVLIQRKVNSSALKNVVFISSNISNFGAKAFSAYASSKGALDSLMRCLAVELAPNVRVNSVLPGAIHSEMTDSVFENKEVLERMSATYPLGLGKPEYIFGAVEFLLSEKAHWITGQQLTVDGGRTVNISG